jgi:hypothetical protein
VRREPLAHEPFVLLGLGQVLAEGAGELGVTGDLGGGAQLSERLLLDRVRVGQVLGELLFEA